MSEGEQKSWKRRLLLLPPVLIAAGILAFVASRQAPPEREEPSETSRTVRTIEARSLDIVPTVTGYGTVQPATVWTAVAQVSGQIVYMHSNFRRGAVLDEGTEILRIDPTDYELAIAEAEANIRSAEAKLAELRVSEQNSRELLDLERRSLDLKEDQLKRTQELLGRGTVSQSNVDAEQRDTISQRSRVKDIENQLRLLPTQIEVQEQQIAVNRSRLATARLNLERTRIVLPFRARVSQVNVEETQFVQTGSTLGSADDISVSEVEAQFTIARISQFGRTISRLVGNSAFTQQNFRQLAQQADLYAVVRLPSAVLPVEWRGRIVRASDEIAQQTRTVGIVAAVEGSYESAVPGKRPPLTKGMFVEVELRGPKIERQIVVPRSAVHGGRVYLVDDENRLAIRPVTTGLVQGDTVVVEEGLSPGDRIVVSDLDPALPGMLLKPVSDEDLQAELAEQTGSAGAEGDEQ